MIVTQTIKTTAMTSSTKKMPTEYLTTNQNSDAKQKSPVRTKSATRKLMSRSMPTIDRQSVTSHRPLGWNAFFRRARIVISTPKTNWMYGTMKRASFPPVSHRNPQLWGYLVASMAAAWYLPGSMNCEISVQPSVFMSLSPRDCATAKTVP